jgi:uncharacterized repeat protein (TIGR01451 family)
LVLAVAAGTAAQVTTEITLPPGIERVAGSPRGEGVLDPEIAWQMAIVVRVTSEGEYKITAQIDARTPGGVHESVLAHIYVASASDRASASELEVSIPDEMVVTPSADRAAASSSSASQPTRPALDEPVVRVHPTELEATVREVAPEAAARKGAERGPLLTMGQLQPIEVADRTRSVGPSGNAIQGVDLTVEDIWSTTLPLQVGAWEEIAYRIVNQGTDATTLDFQTQLWIRSTKVAVWERSGLCAGCAGTGSATVRVGRAGSYDVWVRVDSPHKVPESDETNNKRTEKWIWSVAGGVDLIVRDLWSETLPLHAGEWENVSFRIANQGTEETTAVFYTKLWVAGTAVGEWYADGLCAGCTAIGGTNIRAVIPGDYAVRATVDHTAAVTESDESNNVKTAYWRWMPGVAADLVVEDIWTTTAPLLAQHEENLSFRVKNAGAADISSRFYIELWVDHVSVDTWFINALDAGETGSAAMLFRTDESGQHSVSVIADTTEVVPESDEDNNVRQETWLWEAAMPTPDLTVEDLWSETSPLISGEMESLSFWIHNTGTAAVDDTFRTELSIDGIRLSVWEHRELCRGCSATGGIDVKLTGEGDHVVAVGVDVDDAVSEASESNNSRSEVWNWQVREADLAVTMVSLPDPVDAGQTLTYELSLTNAGPYGATSVVLTDRLPAVLLYQSIVSSQGECFYQDHAVTCALGDITAKGTAQVTIRAQVGLSAQGSITNSANVVASEPDPNTANNSATLETMVREAVQPEHILYVPLFYSTDGTAP